MARLPVVSRCVLVAVSVASVGVGAFGGSLAGAAAPDQGSGTVLVSDDFSDPTSGFQVFNTPNSYAEYLPDGRFRLGLRGPGSATSVREQPQGNVVEVSSTARWFGKAKTDAFGLVCDAGSDSYWAGLIRMDGKALIVHYNLDKVDRSGALVKFPARLLKKGKRAANEVTLKCIPDPGISLTYLELSLNGTVVAKLESLGEPTGSTGVFIAAEKAGAQFTFDDFQVVTPKDQKIPVVVPDAIPAGA